METNVPIKAASTPRSSRLALGSYVLGLCAGLSGLAGQLLPKTFSADAADSLFLLSGGCGLLALLLGISARLCVWKARGRLVGHSRANAGFALGLASLLVLLSVPFSSRRIVTVISRGKGEVMTLACAVEHYQVEYGYYPGQNASNGDHRYTGDEYRLLLATLQGSNVVWHGRSSNPRGITFLSFDQRSLGATNTGGTAQPGELADPWGNRYEVVADWNGDGRINAPLADGEAVQKPVAVWSYGRRGKAVDNPKDTTHIRSWK